MLLIYYITFWKKMQVFFCFFQKYFLSIIMICRKRGNIPLKNPDSSTLSGSLFKREIRIFQSAACLRFRCSVLRRPDILLQLNSDIPAPKSGGFVFQIPLNRMPYRRFRRL